jgi:uncharacterized sulfatase
LIVYIPPRFRHLAPKDYAPGGQSDRLVSFVDLAPTVLSLAGRKPPASMQGGAFLGPYETAAPAYLYGLRGRMDEREDLVRSVRDHRYVYLRNYLPHRIYGQHVAYMFQTPTTQVWKRLYDQGQLTPAQARFWQPKPPEELYDLCTDPDEVHNLAGSPDHQRVLHRMRRAHQDMTRAIRDVGFLPEGEIHTRSAGTTPYEMGHDPQRYPLRAIVGMANLASSLEPRALPKLVKGLRDPDSAVRYWAAQGILMRGSNAVTTSREALASALQDPSPYVRIPAAEALGRFGSPAELAQALPVLLQSADLARNDLYVVVPALNALDELGARAASQRAALAALPKTNPAVDRRMADYAERLLEKILADLPN